jgi:hypothetical protein
MTVQTRRHRNTLRNAFLALVAVLAILGANLAISGPGSAAHAAPITPAVQQQHAARVSVVIKVVKANLSAAQIAQHKAQYAARLQQIRTLHPNYLSCDLTTWIEVPGSVVDFGGSGYSYHGYFGANLWVLVDYYNNSYNCGHWQSEGGYQLQGGCAHLGGGYVNSTYNGGPISGSYWNNVYHCTDTGYTLDGPVVASFCPHFTGNQVFAVAEVSDSNNNPVWYALSPNFTCNVYSPPWACTRHAPRSGRRWTRLLLLRQWW